MNKELKTENQVLRTKYNGAILELKNVRQYFQSGWGRGKVVVKAVHNVSFDVKKGEVFWVSWQNQDVVKQPQEDQL